MTSIEFAEAVRCLAGTARRAGHRAPAFRSRPLGSANRTIRRRADGSATVAVALRDRPVPAVVADLIDGIIAANRLEGWIAAELRDSLWDSVVSLLEATSASSTHPAADLHVASLPSSASLPNNVVPFAA